MQALSGIYASSSTDDYAVGENAEVYRLTGSAWEYKGHNKLVSSYSDVNVSSVNIPRFTNLGKVYTLSGSSLSAENFTGFNGSITEIENNTTQIWAVTNTGNIYKNFGNGTWNLQHSTPQALNTISATVNGDLAGGVNGKIYRSVGSAWSTANEAKIQPLKAIAFDGNNAVAVGEQGTIITSTNAGSAWNVRYSGTTADVISVSVKGNKIIAGTSIGSVLKSFDGGQTFNATIISSFPVRSVKIGGGTSVFAAAGNRLFLSVNGGVSFGAAVLTATNEIHSVWVDTDGYGYIVGNAGVAYRISPGATANTFVYTLIGTDTDISDDKGTGIPVQDLRSVQFIDRLKGHITGVNGLVLKTTDGGAHWNTEANTGTSTPILALGDGENGSIINGNSVSKLRDRSMEFGTRNWYDELGRLVLSQNAKQFNIENYLSATEKTQVPGAGNIKAYSYTLFDDIGRIIEVGEVLTRATVPTAKHETQVSYNAIKQSFVYNGIKREITRTYYDRTKFSNIQAGFAQENLRPRVASVTYQDIEGANYDRATHYSYDVHGNVKNLIQEINAGGVALKKRMDYDYDLVSGKVNYFYYQKDKEDQLIHKYEYDGDNRIVKVYTSRDAITWDRDAKYDYYAHGPLAKTTIGEHEVETNTYAYTIQGWIKGVNGNSFSYALGYFNDGVHQDYQGIGGGSNYTLSTAVASGKSLYNGNIATMASKTPQFASQGGADWVQQFEYDQLNRITASSTLEGATATNKWKTGYEYDAGGNITKLKRYDKDGGQFDAMEYNYENTASNQNYKTNTNKLRWVDDTEPVADHTSDIDDQDVGNYTYDEIGQLTSDKSKEIVNIEWSNSGKVRKVTRLAGSTKPDLEFIYGIADERIIKRVIEKSGTVKTNYYLRDASQNIISIYESNNGSTPLLTEQNVYGNDRLGILKPTMFTASHIVGQKEYEVTDQLGNVRVTVSDLLSSTNIPIVKSAKDYLPFGMVARAFNEGEFRFSFNGREIDQEWGLEDYKMRVYDPLTCRFISPDEMAAKFANMTVYQFASNTPIAATDLDGLEAFFIHGTESDPKRWIDPNIEKRTLNKGAMNLFNISGNKTAYTFDWQGKGNGPWNNKADRAAAAARLVAQVMITVKANGGSEDVTLIGHSHGGNVAIQSVPGLRKALDDAGYKDVKINLITVATPADNKKGSKENPATYSSMINKHIHLYNTTDVIQTTGANDFNTDMKTTGFTNIPSKETIFERAYDNPTTTNVMLDVQKEFSTVLNPNALVEIVAVDKVGAHSFDMKRPNVVKGAIDSGKIQKIQGKSKPSGLGN